MRWIAPAIVVVSLLLQWATVAEPAPRYLPFGCTIEQTDLASGECK